MTQIDTKLMLQNFLSKNPDIRATRNKGLINRRSLAKYIIEKEGLSKNLFEAIVTGLRRFEFGKEADFNSELVKDVKISTKDKI